MGEDKVAEGDGDGVSIQTDLTMEELCRTFSKLNLACEKLSALEKQVKTFTSLSTDEKKCKYYTGLTFPVLKTLYPYIELFIHFHAKTALDKSSQLILTLMKLRLNLDFTQLAFLFNVSNTTATNYFEIIIEVLYRRLKPFIKWPERDILQRNIPKCFKEAFPDGVTGITPQGTVSFVSEAWGGRASDKQITAFSRFLNFISPHDVVIADRGFLITDSLSMRRAKLLIPAFTKGKKQLHPVEVEETRKLAHVRIHVERIIGMLKNKYRIFGSTIPMSMVCNIGPDNRSILDKMVLICCALVNICPPIVPK